MTTQPAASELDDSQSPRNQPSNEGQTPKAGEGGGAAGESFFIPADMLAGKTYQAGEEITVTVVGHDQDGDLEVTMPAQRGEGEGGAQEDGDWRSELRGKLDENQGNAAQ